MSVVGCAGRDNGDEAEAEDHEPPDRPAQGGDLDQGVGAGERTSRTSARREGQGTTRRSGYKLQWVVINGSAYQQLANGWLGSRVVSVLDSGAEGPGFKSQSRRCRVTVLGKLSTPIVPLFTKQQNW